MKKPIIIFSIITLWATRLFAQEGVAEMNQAARDISRAFFSMEDLSYVIAGIIAIFGSIKVYHKWQKGRDEITFDVLAWGGSCLFIVLMPRFLSLLFGIK